MNGKINEISIEHHSYCNRRCLWCSNNKDEYYRSFYEEMPQETFKSILESINNNRDLFSDNLIISACRYNEPFYNPKLAVERFKMIRQILPWVKIQSNTNGDFLTKEVLESLDMDKLNIVDYDFKGISQCLDIMEEFGVTVTDINYENHRITGHLPNIRSITYRADFLLTAKLQDRANTVNEVFTYLNKDFYIIDRSERTYPCNMVIRTASIDYNGEVFLCYNMRSSVPEHMKYSIGNVNNNDFAELLRNKKADEIRELSMKYEDFPEECKHCNNRRTC